MHIRRNSTTPISENQKITLTLRQFRRLVNESMDDDDFEIDDEGVLVKYHGVGGDVEIPDGVVEIAADAFAGSQTTSIAIPNSVERIGVGAFRDCPLEELDVPRRLLRPILNDLDAAFGKTPISDYFKGRKQAPKDNRVSLLVQ